MRILRLFCLLWVAVWLCGCSQQVPSPTTPPIETVKTALPTHTPAPSHTTTPIPTLTPTPTQTPVPTQTATITPSPGPLPITQAIQRSVTMEPNIPTGFLADGLILLQEQKMGQAAPLPVLGISTDNLVPQPISGFPNAVQNTEGFVSPDGEGLLYEAERGWIMVSVKGQVFSELARAGSICYGLGRWLGPQSFDCRFNESEGGKVLVVNPYTGEPKSIALDIRDFHYFPDVMLNTTGKTLPWLPLVDSSLTRVVYPKAGQNGRYALRDLQTGKDVWVLEGYDLKSRPAWSPNGDWLAVGSYKTGAAGQFALWMIDRQGQAQQWVNFGNLPSFSPQIKWSPDGRYVLMTGGHVIEHRAHYDLFVLDTQTRQMVDYGDVWPSGFTPIAMHWSPDSRHVFISTWISSINKDENFKTGDSQYRNFVLDVKKERLARIDFSGMDMRGLGWVKKNVP